MSLCRYCDQPVLWVNTAATDARIPLEREPDREDGNMLLLEGGRFDGKAITLGGPILDQARADPTAVLYRSHFPRCPRKRPR